jgi:hypothetical protein
VIEDRIDEFQCKEFQPKRMAFLDTLISKMYEENMTIDDVQEEVDTFMFAVCIIFSFFNVLWTYLKSLKHLMLGDRIWQHAIHVSASISVKSYFLNSE